MKSIDAPTPRRVLPDEVAASIQSQIFDGSLQPGDRLPPERELAVKLRVNRSSVREALKKLEQLGLVDVQQGSGTTVRDARHASFDVVWKMLFPEGQPNLPLIRDLLEMREAVAPGILRLAIERATPSQIEGAIAELRSAASPELSELQFADALRNLQVMLADLSGNRVLLILANSTSRFFEERGFRQGAAVREPQRHALRPLILRLAIAMEARDQEVAERSLRDLLHRFSELVLSGFECGADAGEERSEATG
ncbi:MAG: FadR family transcriptional regulator [bacterium]|nr:FadR family transcriptional regulator [bacterium]